MATICLIACCRKKLTVSAAARDLYVSSLFRKARAYAEMHTDSWYILSAEYGLVAPHQVVEPYDKTLNTMSAGERQAWASRVRGQLSGVLAAGDSVVILAGRMYREHIFGWLAERGHEVEAPMTGLGIGQQLAWLNDHLEKSGLG